MHYQFAVIGLGYFGSTVALELSRHRHEVLAVDAADKRVNAIAEQLAHAVIADPSDRQALAELNLDRFDAVLIDLEPIETSMICTLHVQELGARELWVKALSHEHYQLLCRLGVQQVVHPEYDLGVRTAHSLGFRSVVDFIHLGDRQGVVEIVATERLVRQCPRIADLDVTGEAVRVTAIRRGGEMLFDVGDDTSLQAGDQLVVIGPLDLLKHFDKKI